MMYHYYLVEKLNLTTKKSITKHIQYIIHMCWCDTHKHEEKDDYQSDNAEIDAGLL